MCFNGKPGIPLEVTGIRIIAICELCNDDVYNKRQNEYCKYFYHIIKYILLHHPKTIYDGLEEEVSWKTTIEIE